jgi:hypothetical protein
MIAVWVGLWLGIIGVGGAWAQIYRWTDRQGVVHFTDNPARIPAPYRASVAVEPSLPPPDPVEPGADQTQVAPSQGAEPEHSAPAPPPRDRLGRSPDYWQGLAQRWATQLQQYAQERDRLQLLAQYTRYLANGTRDVRDRARLETEASRLEKALAEVEGHIKEANAMLQTTLPLEAARLGADPEWLKPPAIKQP